MSTKSISEFISEALCRPTDYISYSVSEKLAEMYPDRAIVEGESVFFDLEEFARAGHCELVGERAVHNQTTTAWQGADEPLAREADNGWFNVLWRGALMDVVFITWLDGSYRSRFHWIVADTCELAEEFFREVCAWSAEVRAEILVFEGGRWRKSKELFRSISEASFENLILPEPLRSEVERDLPHFFASREMYERHGVPWKRGVLLIGPPGNGKTHAVKAMINRLQVPCLYVKSLDGCEGEHASIRHVFWRARRSQPCVVVLEDVDSLINGKNRSFFLNELDGFAANTGVVVVATTNHPERLDPAILDRPSRFDRKFYFELPGAEERLLYARRWNELLRPETRLGDGLLSETAARTAGFSFAYLKELFVSSLMEWMNAGGARAMGEVVAERTARLIEQMSSRPDAAAGADGGGKDAGAEGEDDDADDDEGGADDDADHMTRVNVLARGAGQG